MTNAATTRRQLLAGLARGMALAAPAGLLGACAGATGGGVGATASLPAPDAPPAPGKPAEPVKAALLLPLGGAPQMAVFAQSLKQAAELALFERNVPGFQLVVRDDKGTPAGAATAATEALADGAEIILGPLFGTSVQAVAPIARSARVPVIAFSNDPAVGGQGVHLLSFFSSTETARVIDYAVRQKRQHFAALIPDDELGRDTEPAFRRAVEAGGARLAMVERYPADMSALIEPAQRVAEAISRSAETEVPIDALFLPSTGENATRMSAMLRRLNLDTARLKLILTSGWDNAAAQREQLLHGAWLAGPDPGGWRELTARFGKTYKAMPPRLASLTYDAVTVAAAFATQPKGQRYTPPNLTRPEGFSGIDGQFRLTDAGPIERNLAVLELQGQGAVAIDGARALAPTGTGPGTLSQVGLVRG